jgi:hypothetical protein
MKPTHAPHTTESNNKDIERGIAGIIWHLSAFANRVVQSSIIA